MGRSELIQTLTAYKTTYPEEQRFIPAFLELLHHPRAYYRDHLPGHITASAMIVDATAQNILLLHHRKLDRWLQPGGHADGDENVLQVARKEVFEETGLQTFIFQSDVFDVDIHAIPARPDFVEHYHYDIRFLFQVDRNAALHVNDESFAIRWFPIDEIASVTGGSDSILRMATKARELFAGNDK